MIRLVCPNLKCRKILAVPENTRGKAILCSSCGAAVRVPADRLKPADSRKD